jgi:hypothetical protein
MSASAKKSQYPPKKPINSGCKPLNTMKKNKKIICIALAVVVALFLVWYFWMKNPKKKGIRDEQKKDDTPPTLPTGGVDIIDIFTKKYDDQLNPRTYEAFSAGGKRLIIPGFN